jgi:uncharacterized protein (DUF305 family)
MRRIALAVATAASVAALLSGCGGHEAPTGREGDIYFAQMMIPHHQQAIEMSEIALSKDTTPAIAELAREIRREQDPEIVLMRAWLGEWGAEELPHSGGPGDEADDGHDHEMAGMATGEQMVELAEAQGREFQRMWLELMIAHHEGAIEMAEQVGGTTEDAEVRALAEAVTQSQQEEIDRMRGLLDR